MRKELHIFYSTKHIKLQSILTYVPSSQQNILYVIKGFKILYKTKNTINDVLGNYIFGARKKLHTNKFGKKTYTFPSFHNPSNFQTRVFLMVTVTWFP